MDVWVKDSIMTIMWITRTFNPQFHRRYTFFSCLSTTKVYSNGKDALGDILKNGSTVLFGGFGSSGVPENSVKAIVELGIKNIDAS